MRPGHRAGAATRRQQPAMDTPAADLPRAIPPVGADTRAAGRPRAIPPAEADSRAAGAVAPPMAAAVAGAALAVDRTANPKTIQDEGLLRSAERPFLSPDYPF